MATDGDTKGPAGDQGGSAEKPLPPSAKRKKKQVTASAVKAKGSAAGRYTAPVPQSKRGPSPTWVPVLMFGLWAVGLAMILLNYMGVLLPGTSDGGNGWYLVGGLGLILGGIITATQYR